MRPSPAVLRRGGAHTPPIDLPPITAWTLDCRCDRAQYRAAKRIFQHRCAVRRLPSLLHVGKVERHHRDAARRQGTRVTGDKGMKMTRTGAMGEDEQRIEQPLTFGRV